MSDTAGFFHTLASALVAEVLTAVLIEWFARIASRSRPHSRGAASRVLHCAAPKDGPRESREKTFVQP